MTTVKNIVDFMETIAPQSKKESWDNVGLLCGREGKEVHTVLVALDPFEDVADEAVEIGADLILTHHPLIFNPLHSLTDGTAIGRTIFTLVRHDISAFNAHTNLDIAPEGVNHCLAKKLGLENIAVIDPVEMDEQGSLWGLMRRGTVEEQALEEFLPRVKEALQAPGLRYASGGKRVHHVAVGGGACGEEWPAVLRAGCDTFLTSDVRYNDFWDARDAGLNIIDAGHFYTENPVCGYLREIVSAAFPELNVVISQKNRDCMKYY
ncbi:MAG: Nif3-like dinuclear metal center hexameric protein [Faecousia sp.]